MCHDTNNRNVNRDTNVRGRMSPISLSVCQCPLNTSLWLSQNVHARPLGGDLPSTPANTSVLANEVWTEETYVTPNGNVRRHLISATFFTRYQSDQHVPNGAYCLKLSSGKEEEVENNHSAQNGHKHQKREIGFCCRKLLKFWSLLLQMHNLV